MKYKYTNYFNILIDYEFLRDRHRLHLYGYYFDYQISSGKVLNWTLFCEFRRVLQYRSMYHEAKFKLPRHSNVDFISHSSLYIYLCLFIELHQSINSTNKTQ